MFDELIEKALAEKEHSHYIEVALTYCLVKYVPGMRLDLAKDEYMKVAMDILKGGMHMHSHLPSDENETYTVEITNHAHGPVS